MIISIISIVTGSNVKLIGGMGDISGTLPNILIPNVVFNFETLRIILPYSISLAFVGLIESILTAQILDDMTNTTSDKNQECLGQGIGNVLVVQIPLAALVAVMIMVAMGTFGWDSITLIHKIPKLDTLVMIVTVMVVLATHNLAVGVLVGVILDKIINLITLQMKN